MSKKIRKNLGLWLKAIRAPFFTATVTSGIVGAVCAWHNTGNFNWVYFFLTLLGIVLLNTGTNLINDYFDHTSNLDEIIPNPTKFSGGSRVIQEKLINPKKIFLAGLFSFILASLIGLYLNWQLKGNVILIIGMIGVFLGYFYTAEPLRIGYTPLAEIVAGFCCGFLIIFGSYYVQAQILNFEVFWISIPMGLLVFLILLINEFLDYDADKVVNKKTLVVVLGKEKASSIYCFLLFFIYLIIIFGIIFKIFPFFALMTLITIPLAFRAIKIARKNCKKIQELLPANADTIRLHLFFGLLLSVGYLLDRLFNGR